jgi:hypothetical protein
MTSLLFDSETGRIFNESSNSDISSRDYPTLVECVRQICLAFKKVEIPCTPERTSAALEKFIETEHEFCAFELQDEDIADFDDVSRVLWAPLTMSIDIVDGVPRHGPGATAERLSGNQKWQWRFWHERLEHYFPFLGNGLPLGASLEKEFEEVSFVQPEHEQPVRVVPVPKTLKSPRIIAIEPCCMQFAQQGLRDLLYAALERYRLTAGHINFADQSVNQRLAIMSSKTGQLATIDLSDASDRVPRDLALRMFSANPELSGAIEACRSTHAEMPDGRIIGPLGKFASMGSALCFPVEAMYFYTICVVASLKKQNLPVNYRNIFSVTRSLYVYGDDILCPSTNADFVLDYLRKYNCKVNNAKTFYTGRFRESCGVDAYAGEVVTPTYIGTMPPENKRQAKELISWTATANLFYKRGYWQTASLMFKTIEAIVGPLPYISETTPGLGRISYLGYQTIDRWSEKLQRFEVRTLVPSPVFRTGELEGYAALAASLSRQDGLRNPSLPDVLGREPDREIFREVLSKDKLHLERYALHGAVSLKRRWVPAKAGFMD